MAIPARAAAHPINWRTAIMMAVLAAALGSYAASARSAEAVLCDGSDPNGGPDKPSSAATHHPKEARMSIAPEPGSGSSNKPQGGASVERVSQSGDSKGAAPR